MTDLINISVQKYYKITNAEENHNTFQYKDGLNVDTIPFNNNPKDRCCEGGLYFTTVEHLYKFLDFGVNVREVILPLDDPEFKMVSDLNRDKFRANKIILGWKKSIFNIDVVKEFKLYLHNNFVDYMSKLGAVNVLEWFKNSGYEFKYTSEAIDCASWNGHVNVLEWFKNSGYAFKYTSAAIDYASSKGHVGVLEWFKNSKYEFKYSSYAIKWASSNGHITVLEWFKKYGYTFKCIDNAVYGASLNGHVAVLEWFKNSVTNFKYTTFSIQIATAAGHVDLLKWFEQNPQLNSNFIIN